ncbi:MAG: glycosyltransferase family 2 protein [Candidatus Hydrogenedentes bacterium]|nr:glycosyltransferase family 2 protein [Candidatus Hydrogenedentota bacterium]
MTRKALSKTTPAAKNSLRYSIIIPAYNEEENIVPTIRSLATPLRSEGIPFEFVVVNDNSNDKTAEVVEAARDEFPEVLLVHNTPPGGLGRAVRCGLKHFTGDVVAVVMADLSDQPDDVVRCYRVIEEGFDCAFGSRFLPGSKVTAYPPVKLFFNRLANHLIRIMFWTRHNDLTNAFKVYRRHVIEDISPLRSAHFNITIEMSLSALIRRYSIAMLPISWSGRTWGQSNLKLNEMGRRYLCTLLKIWFERLLILDDLVAEMRPIRDVDQTRGFERAEPDS